MNRALDAEVAKAKGWMWFTQDNGKSRFFGPPDTERYPYKSSLDSEKSRIENRPLGKEANFLPFWPVYNGGAWWLNEHELGKEYVPHYSTDMNEAMKLIEEMGDSFYAIFKQSPTHGCYNVQWYHYFDNGVGLRGVVANTIPEAICKAYLAWKKEEQK